MLLDVIDEIHLSFPCAWHMLCNEFCKHPMFNMDTLSIRGSIMKQTAVLHNCHRLLIALSLLFFRTSMAHRIQYISAAWLPPSLLRVPRLGILFLAMSSASATRLQKSARRFADNRWLGLWQPVLPCPCCKVARVMVHPSK